jgi:hypothetical protein
VLWHGTPGTGKTTPQRDAHERTGQALSGLLNVTTASSAKAPDIIVLVTTNEPLRSLYAAVTRPGSTTPHAASTASDPASGRSASRPARSSAA